MKKLLTLLFAAALAISMSAAAQTATTDCFLTKAVKPLA